MNVKVCSRRKATKSTTEFCKASARRDGFQPACKDCMADSWRRSRLNKLEHYKEVQKTRVDSNKQKYAEWKVQQKCCLCDESDPVCLDVHHLDPTQKEFNVSDNARYASWSTLQAEIDKCVVLCANCHRKVHGGSVCIVVRNMV